MTNCILRN